MSIVVNNVIIKSVGISKTETHNNKLQVSLHIKFNSKPITFDLDSVDTLLSLLEVCGTTSVEDIKQVPIRVMQIKEQCLRPLVAIGHIVSDKWLFFDEDKVRTFNYLKSYFGVQEITTDG